MRTVIVVQARLGSTRLPGKVLLPLAGQPALARQLERIRAARSRFELCVATTTHASDEPIRELCRRLDVDCLSGHPTDLLARHVAVGRRLKADAVVKIPSDCPLIDPDAIDRVLTAFDGAAGHCDLATNLCPGTWPDGNDVEVVPFDVLERAEREATRAVEREHTTPFIWDQPERFRILNVRWETGLDYSNTHRFTLDYAEDYAFISAVYAALCTPLQPVFSLASILELLERCPELRDSNARLLGTSWQTMRAAELRSSSRIHVGPISIRAVSSLPKDA
jgi:spore coat polysaccharide biosynthesis protein SpsF